VKIYSVNLTDRAEQNWRQAYEWYADRSLEVAQQWYDTMLTALDSLKLNPERWPLADESQRFPIELRQLNFGSGRRITHRILFAIRRSSVVVYAIRHVAQGEWNPGAG
jgi:plasmid stabilization system protein ParE